MSADLLLRWVFMKITLNYIICSFAGRSHLLNDLSGAFEKSLITCTTSQLLFSKIMITEFLNDVEYSIQFPPGLQGNPEIEAHRPALLQEQLVDLNQDVSAADMLLWISISFRFLNCIFFPAWEEFEGNALMYFQLVRLRTGEALTSFSSCIPYHYDFPKSFFSIPFLGSSGSGRPRWRQMQTSTSCSETFSPSTTISSSTMTAGATGRSNPKYPSVW